jgi:PAS domain S-box-containing protein
VEIPILHADGTVSTLLWNSANVLDSRGKAVVATIAQGHDITERKKAEEAMRESEETLKESQEIAHLGSWKLDLVKNVLSWSDETYRIFGLTPQEFGATYEAFLEAVHPDDRKKVDDAYSGSIREGRGTYEVEHRVIRKYTGEIRTVHEKCYHVRDASGRIIQSIGIVHDITESKKVEEVLKKSEEKYRSLVEPNIIGILSADLEGIIDANEAFLKIVGYTHEDLVEGKIRWKDMTPNEYQVLDARAQEEMLATGSCAPYEKEYFCKDGNRVQVLIGAGLLQKSPLQWVLFVMDMTERKKLQERLRSAERFSTIGQTAAMVGHDLRNPLQSIVGFIGLAEEQLNGMNLSPAEKQELKSKLGAINEQARYMNKIVSDLQDYSQPVTLEPTRTDVGRLINDTIATSDIPSNIIVSIDILKTFPHVKVDSAILRRVLTNLITNAVQAMPNGGKLNVKVSKKTNPQILVVSVKDTGMGIPPEDRPKMFMPLFTTKSKGQGFGLPVCKRLLEAQGGTISFNSQVGKGSKFTITIPLTRES